jgi:hypothetical protein
VSCATDRVLEDAWTDYAKVVVRPLSEYFKAGLPPDDPHYLGQLMRLAFFGGAAVVLDVLTVMAHDEDLKEKATEIVEGMLHEVREHAESLRAKRHGSIYP